MTPHESSGTLQRIWPILMIGTGIAFNILVGFIALQHLDDRVALIKLLIMEVPAASIYVSGGNRISMLIHLALFGLIAVLSAWGGNFGLVLTAFSIMTYALLNMLQQIT